MKKRIVLSILCLLFVMTLLGGCTLEQDTERQEASCKVLLDCMIKGEPDEGYALLQNAATREEYDAFCAQIAPIFDGISSYELKRTGWSKNTSNGVTTVEVTFEAKLSNGRSYIVSCAETEGVEGLTGFHVQESKQNIIGDTSLGLRIVFIVLSVLFLALAIWMIVDCVKRKPDGMVLWIVLMLCAVRLSVEAGGGTLDVNWGITLIASFSTIGASNGALLWDISFPVGAVVYFFLRKKLPCKKNGQQQPEPIEGTFTESAPEESKGE